MAEIILLHGHADVDCWRCLVIKIWRVSDSFFRSILHSDRSQSFSVRTLWQWYKTIRNRFVSSRFSTLSRFTWFLRLSMCFCFRIRDRLADSRFDTIRLRFLSSMAGTGGFGSSEPEFEFELSGFWPNRLDSSEPELEPKGFGEGGALGKASKQSQGVKPFSKN